MALKKCEVELNRTKVQEPYKRRLEWVALLAAKYLILTRSGLYKCQITRVV